MEYQKTLSPKYLQIIHLSAHGAGLIFFGFLYNKAILLGRWDLMIILGSMTSLLMFWIAFCINKFIYAKIDLKENVLIYGNLLFEQQVQLSEVELVGRWLYFKRIFRVKILGKKYLINSTEGDLDKYINKN
jgi:hypothetical protein